MGGVAPGEGDVTILERNEAVIADGDVGLGAEITQSVCRATEGTLDLDDPVVAEQGRQPLGQVAQGYSFLRSSRFAS